MKRSDRELFYIAVLLLAIVFLVTACKAHFEEEGHTHSTVAETVDAAEQVDTHIVDAPDRTTTTIEEFGGGTGPGALLVDSPAQRESPAVTSSVAPAVPATGRYLVKRTVTVTEHGAVTIDTHAAAKSQERDDSTLDDQHQAKQGFDFLSSPLTWIGAAVVAAGVAFGIWKLRKAVPL